ncbi:MAG TPA: protein kinase [Pyrinomonadaceae bacterium]|nr:protein kinase [Pyrinomonadaceae bacterium]
MICPNCKQPLRDGSQFCTRCGARTSFGAGAETGAGHAPAQTLSGDETIVPSDPLVGRVLDGKYELLARIGHGGMGAVYRARRVHIGDEVAVKLLHAQLVGDESLVERFRREARAAAQLHHPHIVTIHDYGEARGAEGFAYIVMELVLGTSLRQLLKSEGRLETARAVSLMRDVCSGVGAAHRRGIVHRDLKPDNVIVVPPDEDHAAERVKVVDFGIAKLRDMAVEGGTLTEAGAVVGTPFYMSPEQCRGEHLDARSDVYSLGAMLYEMLAGAPPFTAPNISGVIIKHVSEAPPPLPLELGVPQALRDAVMRALSKDPEARQSDAADFGRDIQAAASGAPTTAATPRAAATEGALFPTDAPPARVVPVPPVAPPARPQFTPPPPAQMPPLPPPPRPRGSRAGLVIGILLGGLVVLGVFAVVGLVYLNSGRSPVVATNTRPRPTPLPRLQTPTPSSTPTPTPTPSPTPLTARQIEEARNGVGDALKGWADSTRDRDIDAHMRFYADRLEFYYSRGMPASQVRADRESAFRRYEDIDVKLSNIQIAPDPTGNRATATFDKTWDFQAGDRHSTGSVRQQLTLVKTGDRWLITAEKDLKVYYRNSEEF